MVNSRVVVPTKVGQVLSSGSHLAWSYPFFPSLPIELSSFSIPLPVARLSPCPYTVYHDRDGSVTLVQSQSVPTSFLQEPVV